MLTRDAKIGIGNPSESGLEIPPTGSDVLFIARNKVYLKYVEKMTEIKASFSSQS